MNEIPLWSIYISSRHGDREYAWRSSLSAETYRDVFMRRLHQPPQITSTCYLRRHSSRYNYTRFILQVSHLHRWDEFYPSVILMIACSQLYTDSCCPAFHLHAPIMYGISLTNKSLPQGFFFISLTLISDLLGNFCVAGQCLIIALVSP